MHLLLAAAVGILLGTALGLFGGGGGILAVPLFVGLLGMDVDQAATASLVVVLFAAVGGLLSHHRAGRVLWAQGAVFGATGLLGSVVGTMAATHAADWAKLATFTILMVAAGLAMLRNAQRQPASRPADELATVGAPPRPRSVPGPTAAPGPARSIALLVLLATGTGVVTGFLGVGGGFLVVPALVLTLGMPMATAAATGLIPIAMASATSLAVRVGHAQALDDPGLTSLLVLAAVASSLVAARFSGWLSARAMGTGFALLVLGMSLLVAHQALAALHAG